MISGALIKAKDGIIALISWLTPKGIRSALQRINSLLFEQAKIRAEICRLFDQVIDWMHEGSDVTWKLLQRLFWGGTLSQRR